MLRFFGVEIYEVLFSLIIFHKYLQISENSHSHMETTGQFLVIIFNILSVLYYENCFQYKNFKTPATFLYLEVPKSTAA